MSISSQVVQSRARTFYSFGFTSCFSVLTSIIPIRSFHFRSRGRLRDRLQCWYYWSIISGLGVLGFLFLNHFWWRFVSGD
jgi:hypothetical protein